MFALGATLYELATSHKVLISIEEGAPGGFAAHVMQFLTGEGLLDGGLRFRPMTLPDELINHDSPAKQLEMAGLQATHIVDTALAALGVGKEVIKPSSKPSRA